MNWDDFRIEFDEDGTLRQRGRNDWREPECPVCSQPVLWVLDMGSFVNMHDGSFAYAHARCAWKSEAFVEQARRAAFECSSPPEGG